MRHFCSYFDHRYMERGLALLASLSQHSRDFRLYVLCLDDICYDALAKNALEHVVPIRLPDLEAYDADLLACRARRSLVEYYFTLTPALPLYLLARFPEIDLITYLDSDLFFFDDIERAFEDIGDASIAIIGHRFAPTGQFRERYGIYNVGWISWRRDASGLACLEDYRNDCISWCYDNADGERFADQKYLDKWPTKFANCRVVAHKGCNLAPWNLETYVLTLSGDRVVIEGDPLVFYHFQSLKEPHAPTLASTNITTYATAPITYDPELVLSAIYMPYAAAMRAARDQVAGMDVRAGAGAPNELRHTNEPPAATPVRPWRDALDWATPEEGVEMVGGGASVQADDVEPRARNFSGELGGVANVPELFLEAQFYAAQAAGALSGVIAHLAKPGAELARLRRASSNVGGDKAELASLASKPNASLRVLGEALFERDDIHSIFSDFAGDHHAIILDGVRTFTDQQTQRVVRRPLGETNKHAIWIVNRGELERELDAAGYAIARDHIWDETTTIPPLPERADRRTILALRKARSTS